MEFFESLGSLVKFCGIHWSSMKTYEASCEVLWKSSDSEAPKPPENPYEVVVLVAVLN